MKSISILVALTVFVAGCATRVAGLKQSPTFTYSAVASGKMAIGGVVSAVENLDDGRRSTLAGILRNELLEEREDYSIAPVGNVVNKLGAGQYNKLLVELQTTGTLSDKSVQQLKVKLPDVRYVSFARIENDTVTQDRDETAREDKNGKRIEGSEQVHARSVRNVTASMTIYDLREGNVAWTGSVSKGLTNSRSYTKEKEHDVVSVINAIRGQSGPGYEQKYPYPAAPDTQKVLAAVFEGFGENLPEKD